MTEVIGSIVTLGAKKTAPDHPVRFSYLTVEKARVNRDEPEKPATYSVQIIVRKDSPDVARIHAAMRAAHKESSKIAAKDYDTLDLILRDGDDPKENKKKAPHLFGCVFFNASASLEYPPQVLGATIDPDTGRLERLVQTAVRGNEEVRVLVKGADGEPSIKSGDYGAVTVKFYGYAGKKVGISAGLRTVQKRRNGESLAGGADDSAFEAEDDADFLR